VKNLRGDDEAPPTPMHATTRCHQSNFHDNSSDEGDNEEYNNEDPSEMLDQDKDVLSAAEEAQQEDLDNAAEHVELEVKVMQAKWDTASAALSKVSQVSHPISTGVIADCPCQLTKLAYKINNSSGILEEWNQLCRAVKIEPYLMIKPVDTQWDSKSCMIACALYLKPTIEDICTRKSYVAKYNTGRLKLGWEEWTILTELEPLLGVCPVSFSNIS
jgi:hypothetical protein